MNTVQNRKEWVRALRSGEYNKGRGALKKKVSSLQGEFISHCPWGVACEVYQESNPTDVHWLHNERNGLFYFDHGHEVFAPYMFSSEQVVRFFGMQRTDMNRIAQLSDDEDLTFDDIAYLVENYEESDYAIAWNDVTPLLS